MRTMWSMLAECPQLYCLVFSGIKVSMLDCTASLIVVRCIYIYFIIVFKSGPSKIWEHIYT